MKKLKCIILGCFLLANVIIVFSTVSGESATDQDGEKINIQWDFYNEEYKYILNTTENYDINDITIEIKDKTNGTHENLSTNNKRIYKNGTKIIGNASFIPTNDHNYIITIKDKDTIVSERTINTTSNEFAYLEGIYVYNTKFLVEQNEEDEKMTMNMDLNAKIELNSSYEKMNMNGDISMDMETEDDDMTMTMELSGTAQMMDNESNGKKTEGQMSMDMGGTFHAEDDDGMKMDGDVIMIMDEYNDLKTNQYMEMDGVWSYSGENGDIYIEEKTIDMEDHDNYNNTIFNCLVQDGYSLMTWDGNRFENFSTSWLVRESGYDNETIYFEYEEKENGETTDEGSDYPDNSPVPEVDEIDIMDVTEFIGVAPVNFEIGDVVIKKSETDIEYAIKHTVEGTEMKNYADRDFNCHRIGGQVIKGGNGTTLEFISYDSEYLGLEIREDVNLKWRNQTINITYYLIDYKIPNATIDRVSPNPANEGQSVWFYGNGTDDNEINAYEWRSDIDGILSDKKSFSISTLSKGIHTIYFKVKDEYNTWSEEVSISLTINFIPIAIIDNIIPNPANPGEEVTFTGNYLDFENNITEFYWESNIDGFLSNEKDFSIDSLSNGSHNIIFRVKDNYGVWSENDTLILIINGIPYAIIDAITPNPVNESEEITFNGNFIDFENDIVEFYWESDIEGFLDNEEYFTYSGLSNGTHIIKFRVKDNYGIWSENVTDTVIINGIPRAIIKSISSNSVNENDTIWFNGSFIDFENNIIEFYWESNIDGFISDLVEFSTNGLSNGSHEIIFRVKDNYGVWSNDVFGHINVNGIPIGKIAEITPNPTDEGQEIQFIGNFIDFENSITEFYWESNIDGFLSSQKVFAKSDISNGTHNIMYKVKDSFEVWSDPIFKTIEVNGIPIAAIDSISPEIANENELVMFNGSYQDFENNIIEFKWDSNINGFLSDKKDFSLNNLSNGTHTISFSVKDDNGIWADPIFKTLIINGLPIAVIDSISPNPGNESEEIILSGNYIDYENNIIDFNWESDNDGFLSKQKDLTLTNLSNGTHSISFKVKDNYGIWSELTTKILTINGKPFAIIESISPDFAIEGEDVFFKGNYTDFENNIKEILWKSDIDEFLSDKIDFSINNLSVGEHTITFKVKDNYGVWSKEVISKLEIIKRLPKLEILEIINQESALENQNVTINVKIKNIGYIQISNLTLTFYLNDKEIEKIKYEKILEQNEEDSISTTWQAVVGNHTIKVKIETNDGKLLDEKVSNKKLEVVKEWEGDDGEEEDSKIPVALIVTLIVIVIIVIFVLMRGNIIKRNTNDDDENSRDIT